jgi:hypothetical protein
MEIKEWKRSLAILEEISQKTSDRVADNVENFRSSVNIALAAKEVDKLIFRRTLGS